MARVTLDRARRWHVSFAAPQPTLEREPTGAAVGVDAGVVATLTTPDSAHHHAPALRPGQTQRLRRLQRCLARQQKGSKLRAAPKAAIAGLKAREADRRRDRIEQTTPGIPRFRRGRDVNWPPAPTCWFGWPSDFPVHLNRHHRTWSDPGNGPSPNCSLARCYAFRAYRLGTTRLDSAQPSGYHDPGHPRPKR